MLDWNIFGTTSTLWNMIGISTQQLFYFSIQNKAVQVYNGREEKAKGERLIITKKRVESTRKGGGYFSKERLKQKQKTKVSQSRTKIQKQERQTK